MNSLNIQISSLLIWRFYRKLLHQVVEGKEVSQEENFLPKRQRVKDLCQRAEYQTPCQQTGQVQYDFTPDSFTPRLLIKLLPKASRSFSILAQQ